jgi:hypothetical protein
MDADGKSWYQHAGEDLYLHDLLFQARIQTARRASQRVRRFPLRDRVLDRLIEEGTFDRRGVTTPNTSEEVAMQHSSAMVQRLLMRVEHLESAVCLSCSRLSLEAESVCQMEQAKSQVQGSEDCLLSVGTSVGWGEVRLRGLEARVAEQEAQIAALRRQVYLDEEAAEREVTWLLDEDGEGDEEGLLKGVQALL